MPLSPTRFPFPSGYRSAKAFAFALLAAALYVPSLARAALVLTETLDPATLAATVMADVGGNVTIDSVTVVGAEGQAATFTNGLSVPGFIDFEQGIVLSSGQVSAIAGPNTADDTRNQMPDVPGSNGDADFDTLSTSAAGTFDAVYVIIEFTPQGDTMTGTFTFSSEEYNEYAPPDGAQSAGNQYFDVMGFFVNGVNYSTTADGGNVSINTVNKTLNSADFIDNDFGDFGAGNTPVDIEPDGFTTLLVWTAPVDPGVSNTLKFGVADGGDDAFDSWLLVGKDSFRVLDSAATVDLALEVSDGRLESVPGEAPLVETVLTNLGPESTAREIRIDYTLPAGVTINGGLAAAIGESGANGNEWACTSDAASPQTIDCRSVTTLGHTPGNERTTFAFALDPLDASLVGETLTIAATVSASDTDTVGGNDDASDTTLVVASDTTPPSAAITGMPSITGATTPFTVTVTFDEPVNGLAATDIVVAGATAAAFAIVDSRTATLELTPDGSGDIVLSLPAASAQDFAGNDSAAAGPVTTVYAPDSPLLSIDGAPGVVGDTDPFRVTFAFSEPVGEFVLGDILVGNGSASDLVAVDASTWTALISPDTTSDISIDVPAGSAVALDDGTPTSGDAVTVDFNASAPSVLLSGAPAIVNAPDPWTISLAFSESVTGLDLGDFSVAGATLSNLAGSEASWTVDVTPDGSGDVTLALVEGAVVDIAANPNSRSATLLTVYDDVAPDGAFSNVPTWANDTTPYSVTLTFSEPVPGFTLGDIVATNASLGAPSSGGDTTLTFSVTPEGDGDVALSVAAGAASDVAGNPTTASIDAVTLYDDVPPVLAIDTIAGDDIINSSEDDAPLEITGTTTGLADGRLVALTVGDTTYLAFVAGGLWSATVDAFVLQGLAATSTVTADASDAAGNAAVQATRSVAHDADAPPEPSITALATGDSAPTLSGSATIAPGDVLAVALDGVTYTVGDGALALGAGNTWTLDVPAGAALPDGTFDVTVTLTDAAGNVATENTSGELVVDTVAPAAPSIAPDLTAADDSGASAVDDITRVTRPAIRVAAGSLEAGSAFTLYVDGSPAANGTVAADGSFAERTPVLAEGVRNVTYTVSDAVGNESAASPVLAVTIDATAPLPVVSRPIAADDTVSAVEATALTLSGSADAFGTVELALTDGGGASVAATALVDPGGAWSVTGIDLSTLADGALSVVATASDIAGNVASVTETGIILDATAPIAPTVDALVTSDTTPSVTGGYPVEPGVALDIVLDGVTYTLGDGHLSVDGAGLWTLVVPAGASLTDGLFDVRATVTDTAGNVAVDTTSDELVVDSVSPVVPTVAARLSASATPAIEGTAVIAPGEAFVVTLDGKGYAPGDGALALGADDTWTLDVPAGDALADGTYEVQARVTDAAGNVSVDTSTEELSVDTTAPSTPTVTAQASDSPTPVLEGTATLGAGETLTVEVDGRIYTLGDGALVSEGEGTWTLTVPEALAEGVYDVTVTVTDAAGNASTETSSGELTVDTTAPPTPTPVLDLVAASDSGESDADEVTNLATVELEVVSEPGTLAPGSVVTLYVDGAEAGTATVDGSGGFAVAGVGLGADGERELTYTLTDEAGNESAASAALRVTLDTQVPAPRLAEPVAEDGVINAAEASALSLSGVSEPGSAVRVRITDGVDAVEVAAVADGAGDWSVAGADVRGLAEGTLEITVLASDAAGNAGTSAAVTATLATSGPTAPTVDARATDEATPTLTGTSEIPGDLVVRLNGVDYSAGAGTLVQGPNGRWSLTVAPGDALADGVYEVRATLTDPAGNVAVDTTSDELVVDTTPPATPLEALDLLAASDSGASATDDLTRLSPVTLAAPAGSAAPGATLVVLRDAVAFATATADPSGAFATSADLTAEGANAFTWRVRDAAGNESGDAPPLVITRDTVTPVPTLSGPIAGDDRINAAEAGSLSLSGTAEPGSRVSLEVSDGAGGALARTATSGAGGEWSLAGVDVRGLAEGALTIAFEAEDVAGNLAPGATASVTLATGAPTLAIAPVAGDDIVNAQESASGVVVGGTSTGLADGATVSVTIDSLTFAGAVGGGAWQVSVPAAELAALPATVVVSADASDASGNPAGTATRTVALDTEAPVLILGPIAGDDRLNAAESTRELLVVGTSSGLEDGQGIALRIDGALFGGVVAGDAWQVTVTAAEVQGIADGAAVTVDAADVAGNAAATLGRTLEVDLIAPTVAIDEPPLVTMANAAAWQVGGDCAVDDAVVVVTVAGATPESRSVPCTPPGRWSAEFDVGAFDDGVDVIAVEASQEDAAGNVGVAPTRRATKTDATPSVTIATVAGDDVINAAEAGAAVTLSGTTVDVEDGQEVTLGLGGFLYTAVVSGDAYAVAVPSARVQGLGTSETVTADVTNGFGQVASQASRTVSVDTVSPAAATINAQLTNGSTPTLEGTATLQSGDTLVVSVNGVDYALGAGALEHDGSGGWTLVIPPADALSDGVYAVEAAVRDAAGNATTVVVAEALRVDSTAPQAPTVGLDLVAASDSGASETDEVTSESAPRFVVAAGGATAGLAYVLYEGTTAIGTGTVEADGSLSIVVSLGEGTHALSYRYVDEAGNESGSSAGLTVVVDTVGEEPAVDAPIAGDGRISAAEGGAVGLSGSAEAGSLVRVTIADGVGGSVTGVVKAAGDGGWTLSGGAALDVGALEEGTLQVVVRMTDVAGNEASAAAVDVEHDPVAPPVPTVEAQVTNDPTPVLAGTVEPGVGGTFEVVVDGTTWTPGGALVWDGVDRWSLELPPDSALGEGTHEVVVRVFDAAGNVSVDVTLDELRVDATPPPPPSVVAQTTSASSPTLAGEAALLPGDVLEVTLAGRTWTVADAELSENSDGTWTLVVGDVLSDGVYEVVVRVIDEAGNVSADTTTGELVIDTVAPAAPTVNASIAASAAPMIDGTAALDGNERLEVTLDGVTYRVGDGALTLGAGNAWTLDVPPANALADGVHDVLAASVDEAGNRSEDPTSVELTVDTVAPAVPTVTAQTTNTATPSLGGTAILEAGEVLTVTLDGVTYTSDGGAVTLDGVAGGSVRNWSLDIVTANALADAVHEVVAQAIDTAGNVAVDTTSDELVVDSVSPVVPTVAARLSASATPAIEGTAVIAPGEAFVVTLDGKGYAPGDGALALGADDTWTLDVPAGDALADGTYEVQARVTDAAGNVSVDTSTEELSVDTTAPSTPTVTAQASDSPTPVLEGTATLGAGETLTVEVDGRIYTLGDGALVSEGEGTWTLTVPEALAEGVYDVTVTVTDAAGNASTETSSGELTVDTTAPPTPTPVLDLVAASDSGESDADEVTNLATVELEVVSEPGTLAPGSVVTLYVDGAEAGTATVDGSGGFAVAGVGLGADGERELTYTLTDEAGNESAASAALRVTLDTQVPAPRLAEPVAEDGVINAAEASALSLSGVSEPGSAVRVRITDGVDAVEVAAVADGAGDWSVAGADVRGLAEGTLEITVLASDAAGNAGTSAAVTATLATSGPTAPTVDARATDEATPTLTGTSEIPGDLVVRLNGVDYSAGAGTLVQGPNGRWSLTVAPGDALADGVYEVRATLTDPAGNVAVDTTSDELVVDTTPPATPLEALDLLAASDSGASATDDLTRLSPVTLAAPAGSAAPGATLVVLRDAVAFATATADPSGAFATSADLTAEGANAFTWRVRDAAGNESGDAPPLVITRDTVTPVPTLSGPIAGDDRINAAEAGSLSLSGTAEPGSRVSLEVSDGAGGALARTATSGAGGEWSLAGVDVRGLAEGALTIAFEAEDVAGNLAPGATASVTLATGAPTLAIAPVAGDDIVNAQESASGVVVGGTSTGLADGATVSVTIDSLTFAGAVGGGAWQVSVPAAELAALPATVVVSADASDASGNPAGTATRTVALDTEAPVLILGPIAGDDRLNAAESTRELLVVGTSSGLEDGQGIALRIDGALFGGVVAGDAWQVTVTAAEVQGIADGAAVTVDAADVAGNAAATLGRTLEVDLIAPTVAIDEPPLVTMANAAAWQVGGDCAVDDAVVVVTVAGATPESRSVPCTPPGRWSAEFDVGAFDDGVDVIAVEASQEDAAGNVGVAPTRRATKTDATPSVTIATVAGDDVINAAEAGAAVTLSGTTVDVEDGQEVTLGLGGFLYTAVVSGDAYAVAVPSARVQGLGTSETVTADVTNGFGQVASQASRTVSVDTVSPAAATINAQLTNGSTPTLEGTATLQSGDTLVVSVNGVDYALGAGALEHDGSGGWTLVIPPADALSDGVYAVEAAVRDAAGNATTVVVAEALRVDSTAPQAPTVGLDLVAASDSGASETDEVTSESAPRFVVAAGGATAGLAYVLYEGTTAIGTGTVEADGSLSIVVSLGEGTHALSYRYVDEAGNESGSSAGLTVVVDTVGEEPAVDAPIAGDGRISAAEGGAVGLSGSAEAGSLVRVTIADGVGGSVTGVVKAAGDGGWTLSGGAALDVGALEEGTLQVVVRMTDVAGNEASAAAVDVEHDPVAPPVPTVEAQTSPSATPTLAGGAVIGIGETLAVTLNGTTYTLGDGALMLGARDTWTLDVAAGDALADGTYDVIATATDLAGNVSVGATPVELIVDATAPISPTVTLQAGNSTTPTLEGTAALGTGEALTVELDGTTYTVGDGALVDNGDGTWTLAVPGPLAEGAYDLTVTVTDAAGNASSETAVGGLSIDTTAPDAPPLAPDLVATSDSGASATDDLTNRASVDIGAESDPAFVPGLIVTLYVDGIAAGTSTIDVLGRSTVAGIALGAEGERVLEYTLSDAAGNESPPSPPLLVTLDVTAPVPTIVTPIALDGFVNAAEARALELNGRSEPGSTIRLTASDGTGSVSAIAVTDAAGSWRIADFDVIALADGEIEIVADAIDRAGNPGTSPVASATFVVAGPLVPTVDVLITNDTTPVLSGTGVGAGELVVRVDGVDHSEANGSLVRDPDGTWSLTVDDADALDDGRYDVLASLTDIAGNEALDTTVTELTIDTVPPAVPSVDARFANVASPVVTGRWVPGPGTTLAITLAGVQRDADDDALDVMPDGSWALSVPIDAGLVDGTYDVLARVLDAAGNESVDATVGELVIDTVPPALALDAIEGDDVVSLAEASDGVVLEGDSDAGDGQLVELLVDGVAHDAPLVDGRWSLALSPAAVASLPDAFDVVVDTRDAAGNAAPRVTRTIRLDRDAARVTLDALSLANVLSAENWPVSGECENDGSAVTITVVDAAPESQDVPCVDGRFEGFFDTSGIEDGDRAIVVSATQRDVAGNPGTAPDESLAKDTSRPALVLVDIGDGGDGLFANAEAVAAIVTGRVGGVVAGDAVRLVVEGGDDDVSSDVVVDATGDWATPALDLSSLDDGPIRFVATATDAAGNVSEPVALDATLAATLPALAVTLESIPWDTTPVFGGTTDGPDGTAIEIRDEADALVCRALAAGGTWRCESTRAFENGAHLLAVSAIDVVGNVTVVAFAFDIDEDIDTDADGISDIDEGAGDATVSDLDGDGVPDWRDTDSDGDGIDDRIEGVVDSDGDGLPDFRDEDSDGDGASDALEGEVDSDGDGLGNRVDTDSDGDGLDDVLESYIDSDDDGLPDALDTDSDDDGLPDAFEGLRDTDADGIVDALDLDSDGDRLADALEGRGDSDGDGVPDSRDLDSDNDGLLDVFESDGTRANGAGGANARDGRRSGAVPFDETVFDDGEGFVEVPHDRDGDLVPDHRDLDSDNDAITDAIEAGGEDANGDGRIDGFRDLNGNGWDDATEDRPLAAPDTDGDGLFDFRDADSDQDGLADIVEVRVDDLDGDGVIDDFLDEDGDGLDDSLLIVPAEIVDSDGDTLPDFREIDSDDDGLSDLVESGGSDADGDGRADSLADSDGDGIPDGVDVDQTGGADADADGIDDSADADFVAGGDRDLDGIVDAADPDADGDGLADGRAPALGAGLPDGDADGVPDYQQARRNGRVQTGVFGHGAGCSIVGPGASGPQGDRDPLLPLVACAALFALWRRSRRHMCRPVRADGGAGDVTSGWASDGSGSGGSRRGGGRLAFVAACASLVPVFAGAADAFERRAYAGVGFGASILAPVTDETDLSVDDGGGAAVHLHLGYDASPRIGAELAFGSLGEATFAPEGSIAYGVVGVSGLFYSAADRAALARRRGLMGYLRGGIGVLSTSGKDVEMEQLNTVHLALGVGAEYGTRRGLVVRGELLSYDGDARAVQLALLWRFGGDRDARTRDPIAERGDASRSAVEARAAEPVTTPSRAAVADAPSEAPSRVAAADPVREAEAVSPRPDPASAASPPADRVPSTEPRLGGALPNGGRPVDGDRDGIEDGVDGCLGSRSDRPIDERGCDLFAGAMPGVEFLPDSAVLTERAEHALDDIARTLVDWPTLRVRISTHTDDTLGREAADSLTRRQAVAVARHLIGRGVARARLEARAFGAREPLASNVDDAARARNRRVVMTIVD